jgi:hypothetical protein
MPRTVAAVAESLLAGLSQQQRERVRQTLTTCATLP